VGSSSGGVPAELRSRGGWTSRGEGVRRRTVCRRPDALLVAEGEAGERSIGGVLVKLRVCGTHVLEQRQRVIERVCVLVEHGDATVETTD